jgi:hypothetical protein
MPVSIKKYPAPKAKKVARILKKANQSDTIIISGSLRKKNIRFSFSNLSSGQKKQIRNNAYEYFQIP